MCSRAEAASILLPRSRLQCHRCPTAPQQVRTTLRSARCLPARRVLLCTFVVASADVSSHYNTLNCSRGAICRVPEATAATTSRHLIAGQILLLHCSYWKQPNAIARSKPVSCRRQLV